MRRFVFFILITYCIYFIYYYHTTILSKYLSYAYNCDIHINNISFKHKQITIHKTSINKSLKINNIKISYLELLKALISPANIDIKIQKIQHPIFSLNDIKIHILNKNNIIFNCKELDEDSINLSLNKHILNIQTDHLSLDLYKKIIQHKKALKLELSGEINNLYIKANIKNQQLLNIQGNLKNISTNYSKFINKYNTPTINQINGELIYHTPHSIKINIKSAINNDVKLNNFNLIFTNTHLNINGNILTNLKNTKPYIPAKILNILNRKYNFEKTSAKLNLNLNCNINFYEKQQNKLKITAQTNELQWNLFNNMIKATNTIPLNKNNNNNSDIASSNDFDKNLKLLITLNKIYIFGQSYINQTISDVNFKYFFKKTYGTLDIIAPITQELISPFTKNLILFNSETNPITQSKILKLKKPLAPPTANFHLTLNKNKTYCYIKSNLNNCSYTIPTLNIHKKYGQKNDLLININENELDIYNTIHNHHNLYAKIQFISENITKYKGSNYGAKNMTHISGSYNSNKQINNIKVFSDYIDLTNTSIPIFISQILSPKDIKANNKTNNKLINFTDKKSDYNTSKTSFNIDVSIKKLQTTPTTKLKNIKSYIKIKNNTLIALKLKIDENNKEKYTYLKLLPYNSFKKQRYNPKNKNIYNFILFSYNTENLLRNLKIYDSNTQEIFKLYGGIGSASIQYNTLTQDTKFKFNIDNSEITANNILLQLISFSSISGITTLLQKTILNTNLPIKTSNIQGTLLYNPNKTKHHFSSQFNTESFVLNTNKKSFIDTNKIYLKGRLSPNIWGVNKVASFLLINNKLSKILLKDYDDERILQLPFSKTIKF